MIHYVTGDLLRFDETIIAHGCNCIGVMGAGIAAQIAREMPDVKAAYVADAPHELGTVQVVRSESGKTVFNLMTQYYPGPNADLKAITSAFYLMATTISSYARQNFMPTRVGIPRIGCGIGGLRWPDVESAIRTGINASPLPNLDLVVYDLPTENWSTP